MGGAGGGAGRAQPPAERAAVFCILELFFFFFSFSWLFFGLLSRSPSLFVSVSRPQSIAGVAKHLLAATGEKKSRPARRPHRPLQASDNTQEEAPAAGGQADGGASAFLLFSLAWARAKRPITLQAWPEYGALWQDARSG